jgi:hypothetical protein
MFSTSCTSVSVAVPAGLPLRTIPSLPALTGTVSTSAASHEPFAKDPHVPVGFP